MKKLTVLVAALLAIAAVAPISAQGGSPPPDFVIVDASGMTTIDTNQLTQVEQVMLPPPDGVPHFQYTVPGTEFNVCYGCMTFNTYTTADGYTIYAPDTYTATVMAVTGQSPFDAKPDYAVLGNATAAAGLFGALDGMGIKPGDIWTAATGQAQTQLDHTPGSGDQLTLVNDPFALIKLNIANIKNNVNPAAIIALATGNVSGAISSALWMNGMFVFKGDQTATGCRQDCFTQLPPAIPPPVKLFPGKFNTADKGEKDNVPFVKKPVVVVVVPTSPPVIENLTVDCPRNLTITQDDPGGTVRAWKIAPNFPVVVGQDPAKTGVTLGVSMSVPPVYVSYNVKNYHSRCEGSGCGFEPNVPPYTIINWETCDRVTETYVDRLANINVSMNLAQSSIDWITGELAAKYPGARVFQSSWNLFPGTAGAGGFISDNTGFSYQWNALQTRDPGKYIIGVNGQTTGTQYTGPRGFSFSQETFSVDLIEIALTK